MAKNTQRTTRDHTKARPAPRGRTGPPPAFVPGDFARINADEGTIRARIYRVKGVTAEGAVILQGRGTPFYPDVLTKVTPSEDQVSALSAAANEERRGSGPMTAADLGRPLTNYEIFAGRGCAGYWKEEWADLPHADLLDALNTQGSGSSLRVEPVRRYLRKLIAGETTGVAPTATVPTLADRVALIPAPEATAPPEKAPAVPENVRTGRRWSQPDGPFSVLFIQNGGPGAHYLCRPAGPDTYLLTKLLAGSEVTYTVSVGVGAACGCDSFRKGGKVCKHVRALRSLRDADRLD